MSIAVSVELVESAGYRPIPATDPLRARFHSINVYSIEGVHVDHAAIEITRGSIEGIEYAIAVGNSLNEATRAALHHELVEDEVAWAKEHHCSAPYALIHVGPTSEHASQHGLLPTAGHLHALGAGLPHRPGAEPATLPGVWRAGLWDPESLARVLRHRHLA
jgi:hypothetical protein